ncbi:MAG TPA: S9 family peptidase [Streptosporangiaceae bacterium]|nr:S9 family peptidase [Streptosporangiaceae bacterium]
MPPFDDPREFIRLPRLSTLALSPDGSWLAVAVSTLDAAGTKFTSSIWRVAADPAGAAASRLTHSSAGESSPAFLPDGSLLFLSKRPAPAQPAGPAAAPKDGQDDGDTKNGSKNDGTDSQDGGDKPAIWRLPALGGEATRVAVAPGGISGLATARSAPVLLATTSVHPTVTDLDADAKRRQARKEAGVTAILHEAGPVRYWDHDLGPDHIRLQAADLRQMDAAGGVPAQAGLRDLTPHPGSALDNASFELSPDGSLAVTSWTTTDVDGTQTDEIRMISVATGERRVLAAVPGQDYDAPRISPDGRQVICVRSTKDSYDDPGDVTLTVIPLDGGGTDDDAAPRDVLEGLDRRPLEAAWSADSGTVFFTADDQGRRPLFRVELASGVVTRLTTDDAAYEQLCPSPDGRWVYALRSAWDAPPALVRLDAAAPSAPVALAGPAEAPALPGTLTEVTTTAEDGTSLRGWLVLPEGASEEQPAPLLLWVHGGPVMSWNAWSWRWNPWLMAARGYAVLLPDPALSTGYGHAFIARGHGTWGQAPFTDALAVTAAVTARPDIDAARTAMMGGSFGGYMANWMAGNTDQFCAIVSHAGLWSLDQMFATTDMPAFWRRMFGDPFTQPERYLANSPDKHVARIRTPMLIIHGDKDYRVPIGEALRLWADLAGRVKDAKFLYFPDENHWILNPGNVVIWYETVLAFLAQHVLGEAWQRPSLL